MIILSSFMVLGAYIIPGILMYSVDFISNNIDRSGGTDYAGAIYVFSMFFGIFCTPILTISGLCLFVIGVYRLIRKKIQPND